MALELVAENYAEYQIADAHYKWDEFHYNMAAFLSMNCNWIDNRLY